MFCAYTRPRYQVSVYRTLCPLVFFVVVVNVQVNSYCHVETVTSDFVRLLSDIEMNDIPSPAIKHRTQQKSLG